MTARRGDHTAELHRAHVFSRVISTSDDGRAVFGCSAHPRCGETEVRGRSDPSPFAIKRRAAKAREDERSVERIADTLGRPVESVREAVGVTSLLSRRPVVLDTAPRQWTEHDALPAADRPEEAARPSEPAVSVGDPPVGPEPPAATGAEPPASANPVLTGVDLAPDGYLSDSQVAITTEDPPAPDDPSVPDQSPSWWKSAQDDQSGTVVSGGAPNIPETIPVAVHINDGGAQDRAQAWSEGHTAGWDEGWHAGWTSAEEAAQKHPREVAPAHEAAKFAVPPVAAYEHGFRLGAMHLAILLIALGPDYANGDRSMRMQRIASEALGKLLPPPWPGGDL